MDRNDHHPSPADAAAFSEFEENPTTPHLEKVVHQLKSTVDALGGALAGLQSRLDEMESSRPGSLGVPVLEAAKLLGCGRSKVYELLESGQLVSFKKVGKRKLITRASLEALLIVAPKPGRKAPAPKKKKKALEYLERLRAIDDLVAKGRQGAPK